MLRLFLVKDIWFLCPNAFSGVYPAFTGFTLVKDSVPVRGIVLALARINGLTPSFTEFFVKKSLLTVADEMTTPLFSQSFFAWPKTAHRFHSSDYAVVGLRSAETRHPKRVH